MSPKRAQGAGQARSLARAFDLSGAVSLSVDEVAVPVAIIEEIGETPWQDTRPGYGTFADGAAGAGRISSVGISAAEGHILAVRAIWLMDTSGAARNVRVTKNGRDSFDTANDPQNLEQTPILWTNTTQQNTTQQPRLASELIRGDHDALQGSRFFQCELGAGQTLEIPIRGGIYLYGGGVQGGDIIQVQPTSANEEIRAAFDVVEFEAGRLTR